MAFIRLIVGHRGTLPKRNISRLYGMKSKIDLYRRCVKSRLYNFERNCFRCSSVGVRHATWELIGTYNRLREVWQAQYINNPGSCPAEIQ